MLKHKSGAAIIILSLFISFVFIQSLFFKFTNAPEPQFIFGTINLWAANTLGLKNLFVPPGIFNQYVIGSFELIASLLLLLGAFTRFKTFNFYGAFLALCLMSGAIFFHLFTPLGIDVLNDGGTLFYMAIGVWLASAILLFKGRKLFKSKY